ncbi:MAG: MFS transporter [Hyphomonadaceae bacterium]
MDTLGTQAPHLSQRIAIVAVLAAMAMAVLDAAIANIALPTISRSLGVSPAAAVNVITAYQLGLVMMLLPASTLGESFGYRRVFTAGGGLFTAASLLCALSPSLEWLVAARFLQGIGGAGIMALGVALLRAVVRVDQFGAAIGWNAVVVALSTAAGPTIGATILSFAPWPWLFAFNLPIGALVLFAAQALPETTASRRSIDPISGALNAIVFMCLVIGAQALPSQAPAGGALLAIALVCALTLIRRESGRETPLVPLDLLRTRAFRISVAASILCFTGQTAALIALTFELQSNTGLSPIMTGVYLLSWPLAIAASGPIAGQLAKPAATAWLCLAGGMMMAVGLATAALSSPQAAPLQFVLCMALCGAGFALFNVPNNRSMFLSAPAERSGAAGGLQSAARLTGQIFGAVTMSLMFRWAPLDDAPVVGLTLGAALTLAAGAVSLLHLRRA